MLELFVRGEEMTVNDVVKATTIDKVTVEKTLSNCKRLGYLEFAGEKVDKQPRSYRLTQFGKYWAGASTVDPRADAKRDDAELALKASALIMATPQGMDSDALADALGVASMDVERALAKSKQHFATCRVMRGGDDFILYRESVSAKVNSDWQRQHTIGAAAPGTCAPREVAAAPAQDMAGLDTDAVYSGGEGEDALGCHVHRLEPVLMLCRQAGELTSRVVAEALGWDRQTASNALWQAAHRGYLFNEDHAQPYKLTDAGLAKVLELETATQSSGGEVEDPGCEEFFCLYSTGDLLVQRDNGQQVHFTPDETRALFQWLDRLGGTDLARMAAPEEVPA
jgi:hypothetical protein